MFAASELTSAPQPPPSVVERFLDDLRGRGCSPNSILAYRNDLTQAAQFLVRRQRSLAVDWTRLRATDLAAWDDELAGRGLAIASRERKRAAVRSLMRHLGLPNAVAGLDPVRPPGWEPPPPPSPLTEDELARLCAAPDRLNDERLRRRDRALIRLAVETGAKITELVGLSLDDVDCAACYVRLPPPAGDHEPRLLPCSSAAPWLAEYMDGGDNGLRSLTRIATAARTYDSAVFVNHRGERLTRQGCWLILREHARAAGIKRSVDPTLLRLTFVDRQRALGSDSADVAMLLGIRPTTAVGHRYGLFRDRRTS